MSTYRKKPVVIEAALFDGELVGEPLGNGRVRPGSCPGWFPAVVRDADLRPASVPAGEVVGFRDKLAIGTLEGTVFASAGDWIIRGVEGELYPCKPTIFAATYEADSSQEPA